MNWYKNLNIKKKLIYSFLFVALSTAVIGVVGYYYVSSINNIVEDMCLNDIESIKLLSNAQASLLTIRGDMRNVMMSKSIDEKRSFYNKNIEGFTEIETLLDSYNKTSLDDSEKTFLSKFKEAYYNYKPLTQQIFDLTSNNQDDNALIILNGDARQQLAKANQSLAQLIEVNRNNSEVKYKESSNKASTARILLIIFLVTGFSTSVGLGLSIAKSVKNATDKILNMALELQKGHIHARADLETTDELGIACQALDQFAQQLEEFINDLHKTADGDASIVLAIHDQGDVIAPALNKLTETLRNLIEEVNSLTHGAINGNLDFQADTSRFKGHFKELIEGVNLTTSTIVANIRKFEYATKLMGEGDLTARMEGEYSGSYKNMQNYAKNLGESLSHLISQVNGSVDATASAASQISSSSEQMAAGSQEQTQQVAEIAGAVEEMTKTILETSHNVSEAADLSKKSSINAEKGYNKVEETKEGIKKIVSSTKETAVIIESLSKQSDEIGEITQVIDDIADQTNLLALNAAIEAARAGEQGRGFAVVADEVRKLAERTTKATKEIANTIKAIQKEAKEADKSMDNANAAVEHGMKLTEEVSEVLNEILTGSKRVTDVVGQVAAASEQQSATSEQIARNIEAVSSVTNQSAAGTEQIARAAEDLNRLTTNLQELVKRFKLDENKIDRDKKFQQDLSYSN